MDDFSLVPVDHQPEFENVSLVPVDYEPFAAAGVAPPVQVQPDQLQVQPSQPQSPQVQAQPSLQAQQARGQQVQPSTASEPSDHGLSERLKLSPIEKAINPITSYPQTYERMRNDALDLAATGINQIWHRDNLTDPQAYGLWDVLSGSAKAAIGGAGYVASPLTAAYRSIIGRPIEDVTGIPREYTELAAQLATPGIGLSRVPSPASTVVGRSLPKTGTLPGTGTRAAETALPAESLGADRAAAEAANEAAPDGRFYSVLFEHRLRPTSYPIRWRYKHNQEANEGFLQAMEADEAFARSMQDLGVNLRRTPTGLAPRRPPPGFTWHHAEEPGLMQLVPRQQHEGSIFQAILHPGGRGGYSIWGK